MACPTIMMSGFIISWPRPGLMALLRIDCAVTVVSGDACWESATLEIALLLTWFPRSTHNRVLVDVCITIAASEECTCLPIKVSGSCNIPEVVQLGI